MILSFPNHRKRLSNSQIQTLFGIPQRLQDHRISGTFPRRVYKTGENKAGKGVFLDNYNGIS